MRGIFACTGAIAESVHVIAPQYEKNKPRTLMKAPEIVAKIIITILLVIAGIFLAPLFGIPTIILAVIGGRMWQTKW